MGRAIPGFDMGRVAFVGEGYGATLDDFASTQEYFVLGSTI
jgi:hypothetical protein